jgi:hypothetical protein
VENHVFRFAFPPMTNPKEFGVTLAPGDTVANYAKRRKEGVAKEFVESRPWLFAS